MQTAIIAGDLTGAADTGGQLVRAGYWMAVVFQSVPTPPAKDLDAVALDTDSRAMLAGFAAKRVLEVGRTVRDARIGYKKPLGASDLRPTRTCAALRAEMITACALTVGGAYLDPSSLGC